MNWSALEKLLEKFYEGTSTADDEKKAFEMLQRNDLPPEFYNDRMILEGLFGKSEIPEHSPDLGKKIMTAIDESEKADRKVSTKRLLYSMIGVAASFLLIISFWFLLSENNRIRDTYSDPQLAYNETVEVLYYLSENLNTGRAQMEELSVINDARTKLEMIPESRNTVSKELEPLRYIENSVELLKMNSEKIK
jgi:hypothetical protein